VCMMHSFLCKSAHFFVQKRLKGGDRGSGVRCPVSGIGDQVSPVKSATLVFFEEFNPDETNKKVSLGTRGPEDGIFAPLRQAGIS
jgi:hypothetical protein